MAVWPPRQRRRPDPVWWLGWLIALLFCAGFWAAVILLIKVLAA